MLEYDECIETMGIKVPFVKHVITPKIERPMRNNRYEAGECRKLKDLLKDGDHVLEIGAGIGLVSSVAAKLGDIRVTAIEANPNLIPVIQETLRINKISSVDLRHGVVSAEPGDAVTFYLRPDFWASSMEPQSRAYVDTAEVPNLTLPDLLADVNPTVISCDIEGAELSLFDDVSLQGVRHIVLELHPKVYGASGERSIIDILASKGFCLSPDNQPGSSVRVFDALPVARQTPNRDVPVRAFERWPVPDPSTLIVTCMKDEGPFILEWIAWHRAVGVTDFLVFTNDCTDGTDALLDRLASMGIVRHLPNPALANGSTFYQPAALAYAHLLPQMKAVDFVISMDVDEFINVRVGMGRLSDLKEATGRFDVLSMSEINHGCNWHTAFAPGWVTDQFPLHESETPGRHKANRGVKSLVRLSQSVLKIRNHRPDMTQDAGEMIWLDGSGRPISDLHEDGARNGVDVRGSYDLVSLEHYPLRSLDSYLVKMFRGDVVVKDKRVSQRYWRMRNRNEFETSSGFRVRDAARREYQALLADPELSALHQAACEAHQARIDQLLNVPEFRERRNWVLENSWKPSA